MNVRENKKRPFHATEKPLHKRDEDKLRGTTLLGALRPPYAVPIHGHSITGVPSKSTRCLSIGSSRMSYLSFGIPFCTKQRLSVIRHESCFLSQPINNILYYITKCKPSSRAKAKKLSKKSIFYTSDKTKARDAHLSRRFDKKQYPFCGYKSRARPTGRAPFLFFGFAFGVLVAAHRAMLAAAGAAALTLLFGTDKAEDDRTNHQGNHCDHNDIPPVLL